MTDGPAHSQRYASLAAQVADLRGIVMQWDARLQHAGLDGSIDLVAKLAELADQMDGQQESQVRIAAPYWLGLSDDEYRARIGDLADWVWNVLVPNYHVPVIRTCWAAHPAAIWELSTLAAEWRRIYERQNPPLADALAWLDRWLPGVVRRLGPVMGDCTSTRCARPVPAGR